MKRSQWWTIAGLMSLMIAIGCSHEQVAKATSDVAYAEVQPHIDAKPAVPEVKAAILPSSEGSIAGAVDTPFVANENLQAVYFELSRSQLDEKNMESLKKNAEWLQKNTPYMVQVAGYTDTRGSTKRNRWLAERRALQVRNAYVALGVSKNRMVVKAIGEEGLACGNLTEECLSQSRRTETLIENKALALSATGTLADPPKP